MASLLGFAFKQKAKSGNGWGLMHQDMKTCSEKFQTSSQLTS